MAVKLPFSLSKTAQAVVATLAAVSSAGTQILHAWAGFLPPNWSIAVSSVLAAIAAVAGFIQKAEPILDELN
jgi:hypothetical protein